jgi:transposase
VVRQVKIDFADPRRSYTKAFERYALELSRSMTILDVTRHLGVSWDIIKDIQKRDLSRLYAKPKLKNLRQIAIDEIAVAKGHSYLTVVLDLESGAVVFVGDGRGGDALNPFWKRLRRCQAKIAAVAMDMSPAYHNAVSTHLPKATIVYDHFHVIKLFNDKLSTLRLWLYHQSDDEQKKVLKGSRWLLLKAAENLDPERDEETRLEEALKLNKPLATASYLKEDLRQFWEQPGKRLATAFLNDWLRRAEVSGVGMLQQMAKTLEAHRAGLLAYYDFPISTGPLEGTNNKIRTMKRQAYGFRDREFFKLKILAIHQAKYALPYRRLYPGDARARFRELDGFPLGSALEISHLSPEPIESEAPARCRPERRTGSDRVYRKRLAERRARRPDLRDPGWSFKLLILFNSLVTGCANCC